MSRPHQTFKGIEMEGINETLAAVAAGAEQRRAEQEKDYKATVSKVAGGAKVPVEVLVSKLSTLNKTPDQFKADVERVIARRAARSIAEQLPTHQAALQDAVNMTKAADAKHTAAVRAADEAHAQEMLGINAARAAAQAGIRAAENALTKLKDTAPPEALARRDAASEAVSRTGKAFMAAQELERNAATGRAQWAKHTRRELQHDIGVGRGPWSDAETRRRGLEAAEKLEAFNSITESLPDPLAEVRAADTAAQAEFAAAEAALLTDN